MTSGADVSSHLPRTDFSKKNKWSWKKEEEEGGNMNLLQETNILHCHGIQRGIYSKEGTYI